MQHILLVVEAAVLVLLELMLRFKWVATVETVLLHQSQAHR
jgi:hypothetical protein